jgi:ribosomal-protein-alanine N-acetyltransferase
MGSQLRFEPIARRHEMAIREQASDPRIAEQTTIPHPYPIDGARRWIARVIERREAGVEHAFAMIDDEELVGVVTVTDIGLEPNTGEWGSWVGTKYWRRGYAAEGGQFIAEFSFGTLRLARLLANVRSANHRSRTLPFKVGFRMTHTSIDLTGREVFHYELLADEFRARSRDS